MNNNESLSRLVRNSKYKDYGEKILIEKLRTLFNCNVRIIEDCNFFKQNCNINIHDNIQRTSYVIDENTVALVVRIIDNNKVVSIVSVLLEGNIVAKISPNILNAISSALTHVFSDSYKTKFQNCTTEFDVNFIRWAIANCFCKGYYDTYLFQFLINLLDDLRCTTFEGGHFSTGIILTRSGNAYKGKHQHNKHGDFLQLTNKISLLNKKVADKRFWYMVDGKSTFYLCNKNLEVYGMFVRHFVDESSTGCLDSYALSKTIMGGDVVFRAINHNQYSILNADSIEFINIENAWKLRDYNNLQKFIKNLFPISDDSLKSITYYIMYCSQNNQSAILWVPFDLTRIDSLLLTKNTLVESPISAIDSNKFSVIYRSLTSDGVTVFDMDANMLYYGGIVDLSLGSIKGVAGTGETAAKLLSKNGVAIKVSQDGNIKIYTNYSDPVIF